MFRKKKDFKKWWMGRISSNFTPQIHLLMKLVYLILLTVTGAGDLLRCPAEVPVGLELHVALVHRLMVHHLNTDLHEIELTLTGSLVPKTCQVISKHFD